MEKIVVDVMTGEKQVVQLTADEVAQIETQAAMSAQADAQWKLDNATVLRQQAYAAEADPLFFKWQAGEGTEAEWRTKREEIRARYPDPF